MSIPPSASVAGGAQPPASEALVLIADVMHPRKLRACAEPRQAAASPTRYSMHFRFLSTFSCNKYLLVLEFGAVFLLGYGGFSLVSPKRVPIAERICGIVSVAYVTVNFWHLNLSVYKKM